jgi:cytochrome c oxidase subunit 2
VLLVVVGTVVFHFWSPWWWTEIASNWGYVDDTIIVTFWITGVSSSQSSCSWSIA